MNKWMHASICGIILLAATGCSAKEAGPATSSPAAVSNTPTPVTTAAAVTPTPQVSATAVPSASASQAAAASATPQPQASATPAPAASASAVPASPKPTATPAPASATPSPSASVKPQPTATTTSSTNAKAELLYKDNCLVCHGVGLAGDYGPNLTKVGSRKTKEQIVTQIMNGKVEMPPFKDTLKPEEIETLANWLAAQK